MKIIFMGTPDFSVPVLDSLVEAGHEVVAVITQPDKPKGRGKEMQPTPVKEAALRYNIPVYQPVKVRDDEFVKVLEGFNVDVMVVVAFGQILTKNILDMPKYGCINVHASLLPKYRGAAPMQWSIIDGETKTGVAIQQMDEGIDTGDILAVEEIELDAKETYGSLHDKLTVMGGPLVVKVLEELENGTVTRVKQNDEESNYVKIIKKSFGKIDFTMDAVKIERLIRGLNPWPSAFTTFNNKTLKIWDADVIAKEFEGEFGEIVEVTKNNFTVKTGKGALVVNELQLEGKKRMMTDAFLRGVTVEKGVILG
ncbi:MAG: methionyl-tRNA formyltransferase [Lachnospiraceae bacterium]|nr:methionyl-tRNA formyltransferase [Lachnospiraceae bacterium]